MVLKAEMGLAEFKRFIWNQDHLDGLVICFLDLCAKLGIDNQLKMLYTQERIGGFNIFLHRPLTSDESAQLIGTKLDYTPRFSKGRRLSFTFYQGEFEHGGNSRCQARYGAAAYFCVVDPPDSTLALEVERLQQLRKEEDAW